VIKKIVKNQYQTQGDAAPPAFARLVLRTGIKAITPQIARNQFHHCRIYIEN
jgi:hypothetical protein